MLAAVQLLTRIPVVVPFEPGALHRAVRYMPLVGLMVGAVAASVFVAASRGLQPWPAALLSLAATLLLTGALHEDGLADCCDGLFGGRTAEDALRIMRDSRVGSFGVLGLVVVLGTKLACLATMPNPAIALIAAHAGSRFWAVLPPAVLPYARPSAQGAAAGLVAPATRDLAIAAVFGLLPLLLLQDRAVPALLLSGIAAVLLGAQVRRRLGGYTGDVLGAMQQVTEIAILLAAAWHAG